MIFRSPLLRVLYVYKATVKQIQQPIQQQIV